MGTIATQTTTAWFYIGLESISEYGSEKPTGEKNGLVAVSSQEYWIVGCLLKTIAGAE